MVSMQCFFATSFPGSTPLESGVDPGNDVGFFVQCLDRFHVTPHKTLPVAILVYQSGLRN